MFIFFTIQIVPLMKSSCLITSPLSLGSPCAESACQSRRQRRYGFDPWVEKIPWSRKQQPTWNLLEFLNVLFPPHEKEKTLAWEYYNYFTETIFSCAWYGYTHWLTLIWTSLVAQIVKNSLHCRKARFNPWIGKIPWEGNGSPLQYSCLENSMDSGVWQATVHGDAKRWT